jgi:hypothetical protein
MGVVFELRLGVRFMLFEERESELIGTLDRSPGRGCFAFGLTGSSSGPRIRNFLALSWI